MNRIRGAFLISLIALVGVLTLAPSAGSSLLHPSEPLSGCCALHRVSLGIQTLRAVDFVSASVGWAIGTTDTTDDYSSCVLKTTDAGKTWVMQVPGAPSPSAWNNLFGLDALNRSIARVVGAAVILQTTDGGADWPYNLGTGWGDLGSTLRGVHFLTTQRAWVVGDGSMGVGWDEGAGVVGRTVDGGHSWKLSFIRAAPTLSAIDFPTATTGCAIASGGIENGKIYRSTDGGAHWRKVHSEPMVMLTALDFANSRVGWAVGVYGMEGGGIILKTTDGGQTWKSRSIAGSSGFYDVDAVDAGSAWAVGSGGTIVRTRDGGRHWAKQRGNRSSDERLRGVSFVSRSRGWAVGAIGETSGDLPVGVVLRTTNSGRTWSASRPAER